MRRAAESPLWTLSEVRRLTILLAAMFLLAGHAPYKQWDVYRKTRLIIVTNAEEPRSVLLGEALAALLVTHLPSSRAMASRAPDAMQIISLLGSHQLDLAILSVRDAVEAHAGRGRFAEDGPLAIRTLAILGSHLFVAYDFPPEYACLVAKTLADRWADVSGRLGLPPAPYLAGSPPVPFHAGALAYYQGFYQGGRDPSRAPAARRPASCPTGSGDRPK